MVADGELSSCSLHYDEAEQRRWVRSPGLVGGWRWWCRARQRTRLANSVQARLAVEAAVSVDGWAWQRVSGWNWRARRVRREVQRGEVQCSAVVRRRGRGRR